MDYRSRPLPRSLAAVKDPEIPAMSIWGSRDRSLGGDRGQVCHGHDHSHLSGCPAMDAIRSDIVATLAEHGFESDIRTVVLPGLDHRHDQPRPGAGIWPRSALPRPAPPPTPVARVASRRSPTVVSEFGSTACKALMVCSSCREPFDLFKELN